ncbi:hypothetical protein [Leisingera sp. F5]|uniref:hypothetical protein n=1 Tax=Leisingera sp. F5 TaxID=1813816 RepID=UPI000B1D0DA2|nr:hypothetical protein [Leisingera sp. F5]
MYRDGLPNKSHNSASFKIAPYILDRIDYQHLYLASTDCATGDMGFTAQANAEDADNIGADNYLEWKSGGNSLIAGAGCQRRKTAYRQHLAYGVYSVSFADPVFDFDVAHPPLAAYTRGEYTEKGFYLQDHFKFSNGLGLHRTSYRCGWITMPRSLCPASALAAGGGITTMRSPPRTICG